MNELMQKCNLVDTMLIYKYIPLKYVVDTLKSGEFIFKKISEWEDVYENYAYKETYQLTDGTNVDTASNMQSRLYGQCWTDSGETDAMWRIYSHPEISLKDSALRVSVTIAKLKDVLKGHNYDIRKVTYSSQVEIEQFLPLHVSELEQFFRNSSFIKREEFSHEKEIRIVVEKESINKDYLRLPIPADFFEEIVLDPRLNEEQVEIVSKMLKNVTTTKIHQSTLYRFNKQTIKILD